MKLLLIEDDPAMRQTLERSLRRLGWLVQSCADGEEGLALWKKLSLDAVLLDLSLPGRDGLEILSDARKAGLTTPVIILTARGTVGDRILGLNTGADDYLPKPFDLDELEARVRALVRARQRGAEAEAPALEGIVAVPDFQAISASSPHKYCAVRYQKESGAFYLHDQPMELSPRESAMLAALFERLGQALSKEQLFERVFPGQSQVQTEAIEVVTYRLRKKLTGSGLKLVTLRGLGYLLKHE
jgi:two-component system, OmpR family, response regulator TctD